ncbi:MAG TPA: DNA-formamidopyrimidine glycosylase family protein [Woeseiaceae bacterium]|nr:DNA-formamidopyrimidine glycosylase family protein [Woeseiaceae bacterium]
MPELPDVEVYRRYIDATSLHSPVAGVEVPSPGVLRGTTPQGLGRALRGRPFEETRRHGKYLFVQLGDDGGYLVLHFGMTGELAYAVDAGPPPEYTACRFRFDHGGSLAYVAPRKLGRVSVTGSSSGFIEEHELGPDALSLSKEPFRRLAEGRRGSVKSFLMNQEVMAGIGNVYSDEILFQAGLHPRHAVNDLDSAALGALWRAMRKVLRQAIAAGAEPREMPESFLLPRRHEDGRCPRCGTGLRHVTVSGRSAWFCPDCQPLS